MAREGVGLAVPAARLDLQAAAVDIEGHDVPLSRFAGKVTLVVNVASQ